MDVRIQHVDAARTHPLRQRVLRQHETLEQVASTDIGHDDATFVAAITGDDEVVGTAAVWREPPPWDPEDRTAWRLRGVATDPARRSSGIGGRVLAAVVAHVADHGGGLLWANARIPAQRFYEREGWITRGDPWEDPVIGPHIVMLRQVRPSPRP